MRDHYVKPLDKVVKFNYNDSTSVSPSKKVKFSYGEKQKMVPSDNTIIRITPGISKISSSLEKKAPNVVVK